MKNFSIQWEKIKHGAFMQLASLDRAELLWLNTHEFLPAKPVHGAECKVLSGDDMKRLSCIKDFGIDEQLASDFDKYGFVAIGIFVENKLAGLSCFSTNDVPARYNRRSEHFNGLEMSLPPGTRYLFNAIVLPEFRGQRLHSAVIRFAIDHFGKDTVHTIVCHYDMTNKAFLASSLDQGFERVGRSAELCVLGKSLYRLPKPIDSVTGAVIRDRDDDRAIVLRKAG